MEPLCSSLDPPSERHPEVARLAPFGDRPLRELLAQWGLRLEILPDGDPITGSYWGDEEAGLVGDRLLARNDTPVHSILHEACHYICMDTGRRAALHTDAGGDYAEENAVCYLQVLLADRLPGYGRNRVFHDMDAWGYSFRLGSARAWFEEDASDAHAWLEQHGLIDSEGSPTRRCRSAAYAVAARIPAAQEIPA